MGDRRWPLERCVAVGAHYREAIEGCIAEMAAVVGADGCLAFQLAASAPRPVVTAVIRGGDSIALGFPKRARVGRDPKPMRSWEADLPDRHERRHTVTFRFRARPAHARDRAVLQSDLLPRGIHDHARRLLYDGCRFLGGVSVERAIDRPQFTRAELTRLDEVADRWVGRLAAAVALDDDLVGSSCAVLFDPRGRCVHASPRARAWMTRERRQVIESSVAVLERQGDEMGLAFVGGTLTRIVRLTQGPAVRYLATIRPTVPPLMHAAVDLSARQREIARYAACGATLSEIGETLGLSTHTVRQHLRRAYGVLGVHSRVALAQAMESVPDDS